MGELVADFGEIIPVAASQLFAVPSNEVWIISHRFLVLETPAHPLAGMRLVDREGLELTSWCPLLGIALLRSESALLRRLERLEVAVAYDLAVPAFGALRQTFVTRRAFWPEFRSVAPWGHADALRGWLYVTGVKHVEVENEVGAQLKSSPISV